MAQTNIDNGGRRLVDDRRQFLYTLHIPERRTGAERRSGWDRRRYPRKPNPQPSI
jgi:hypothetical protein